MKSVSHFIALSELLSALTSAVVTLVDAPEGEDVLVGSVAFNASLRRLSDRDEDARRNNEERTLDPEEWEFAHTYAVYWIVCLLVLLAILATATLDLLAIRRFGRRQISQIQSDRRAMIEREVARMRRDRNGHV